VATPHHLSAEAAQRILIRGGNAVDAAVGAVAAQGVVAPETCGVGGDLFALIHAPGWAVPLALNASGRAGSNASAEALRRSGATDIPGGHPAAVTVPGCSTVWRLSLPLWAGSRRFDPSGDRLLGTAEVSSGRPPPEAGRVYPRTRRSRLYRDGIPREGDRQRNRWRRPRRLPESRAASTRRCGRGHLEATSGLITRDDLSQSAD
jgi:hypothetical protein